MRKRDTFMHPPPRRLVDLHGHNDQALRLSRHEL